MFTDVVFIGAGAVVAGLVIGAIIGSMTTGRRMRRRVEEIGEEMAKLTKVAEQKLLEDDPNLPDLTRNLNAAVEQAFSAIEALEHQSALNQQKTEGAREIAVSSRRMIAMMEEMGADVPHMAAPKLDSVADHAETKAPPRLR